MEKLILKKGLILHPKYKDIAEEIYRKIEENEYFYRLPSLRKLSEEYNANVRTIWKAIKLLEKKGVVRIIPNKGIEIIGKKTISIGIIGLLDERFFYQEKIEPVDYEGIILNYFFPKISEKGDILIYKRNTPDFRYSDLLKNHTNIDGLVIIIPWNRTKKELLSFRKNNIPYVTIGNTFEEPINYVDSDNVNDTKEAVNYLIKKGHRRILFIGFTQDKNIPQLRLEGYKLALKENNIPVDKNFIIMENREDPTFEKKIKKIFSQKNLPTAIFGADIPNTIGLFEIIGDLKEKLDVIVYDDFGDIIGRYKNYYGVIQQPLKEISETAIDSLYKMIKEKRCTLIQIKLKSKLIFKERG